MLALMCRSFNTRYCYLYHSVKQTRACDSTLNLRDFQSPYLHVYEYEFEYCFTSLSAQSWRHEGSPKPRLCSTLILNDDKGSL